MNSNKKVSDYHYLIVGGTTKAATTSLFTYLADHPSICGATYKETRFFLGKDYPLPSKYRYKGDLEEYNQLFPQCDIEQIRLDSTPDYLHCPYALERIAEYLPRTKLVFSLREPISRLTSWYRFARQIGKLPQSVSFDEYVDKLFNIIDLEQDNGAKIRSLQGEIPQANERNATNDEKFIHENSKSGQHWLTLQQGCYASYLKKYIERFGNDRIHILFYEDLAAEPFQVLVELCQFAEIDQTFYENYSFNVTNRTETMRSSELHQKYRELRFQVRKWTHNKPIIHRSFRAMRRAVEPLYLRLNTRRDESFLVSLKTQRRLVGYFKQDVDELQELIGKQPPWQPFFSDSTHE